MVRAGDGGVRGPPVRARTGDPHVASAAPRRNERGGARRKWRTARAADAERAGDLRDRFFSSADDRRGPHDPEFLPSPSRESRLPYGPYPDDAHDAAVAHISYWSGGAAVFQSASPPHSHHPGSGKRGSNLAVADGGLPLVRLDVHRKFERAGAPAHAGSPVRIYRNGPDIRNAGIF